MRYDGQVFARAGRTEALRFTCASPGSNTYPLHLEVGAFLVRGPERELAVFAFAYSLFDGVDDEPADEDMLLDTAVRRIEETIDESGLGHRTDRTFRHQQGTWAEAENPRWWIKAFNDPPSASG